MLGLMVNDPMTNPLPPLFNLPGNFFNKNFENRKISMEKILPVRFASLNDAKPNNQIRCFQVY